MSDTVAVEPVVETPAAPSTPEPSTWADLRDVAKQEFATLERQLTPDTPVIVDEPTSTPEATEGRARDPETGRFVKQEGEASAPETPTGEVPAPEAPPVPPAPPEPAPVSQRFAVVGADGQPVPLALPDGATITFKADGVEKAYTSLDALVQDAQKAPMLDRQVQTMRQRLDAQSADLQQKTAAYDDLVLRLAFDDEYREAVAEELRKDGLDVAATNPKVREAFQKARAYEAEQAQRAAEQQQQTQQQADAQIGQFWQAVEGEYQKKLAEYPNLTPADYELARELFVAQYQATRDQLYAEHYQTALARGIPADDAQRHLEMEARKTLSEPNLYAAMARLNDRLASRATPTPSPAPPPAPPDRRPYLQQKAASADANRGLRPVATTPPAASTAPTIDPNMTWEQKKRALINQLHTG